MSISTGSTDFLGAGGAGFGFGGGGWGGIAPVGIVGLNTLFDRDRGKDCSNGDGVGNPIFGATILAKLGSIEGSIPLAALGTQNAILEQTNALNMNINQANLSQLMASAGVKDAVQNTAAAALINSNNNTQSILGAICGLSSKIDQNRISELETELLEQRSARRATATEINVNQTVNQAQAQQQQQVQFNSLFGVLSNLANDLQAVKQGQVIFNSGTMAASGTQAAANTKVA